MRRVSFALVLLFLGCTYRATESRVVETLERKRVTEVLDIVGEQIAGKATVRALDFDADSGLWLEAEGPKRLVCHAVAKRSVLIRRRHADAIYVPEGTTWKHVLAFTVGLPVLAPIWLPLYYQGVASDEAEAALESEPGLTRRREEGVGRFVVGRRNEDEVQPGNEVEGEELLLTGPLAFERVTVRFRGGFETYRARTNAVGRLRIDLADLRRILPPGRHPVLAGLEVVVRGEVLPVPLGGRRWSDEFRGDLLGPAPEAPALPRSVQAEIDRDGVRSLGP